MRKLIVGAMISLDGVMQAPGGPDEDPTGGFKFGGWIAPLADDPVFGAELGKLFGAPFDLLLGRRTYEIFSAFWPYAEGGPDADIAKTFNRITKYVTTRTGVDLTWNKSVALRDAAKDVAKLKQEDGPTLLTQGSTELVHALLAAGLVDEIRTFTFPLFKLTHSAVGPSGLIAATYARAGEVKTATVGGVIDPSPAELARREKLQREG
jgi:dihydrofolate reductase